MSHQASGIRVLLLFFCIVSCLGCGGGSGGGENSHGSTDPDPDPATVFTNPQLVEMIGYPTGGYQNVQEPFISRDGQYMFFNSATAEGKKDLLFAKWDSGQDAFVFQGEVQGVNTAEYVEGNPTMDENFNFFYINTDTAPSWISGGVFQPGTGTLAGEAAVTGLPVIKLSGSTATVNMGVEISSDGATLYFSRAVFLNAGQLDQVISESDILFAEKVGNAFVYDETTAGVIMQNINTDENLEYAECISEDGLEFFFTRLLASTINDPTPDSQIMRAVRSDTSEAFGAPQPVGGIPNHTKFVEGPTLYGNTLYYHQFDGGVARLYKVTRQ